MISDIERENTPELVCYRCGSFNVILLNSEDSKRVYKCENCGKVWIKRDGNGREK